MFAHQLRAAVEAAPRDHLSDLAKTLWQGFSAGAVTEAEAEAISLLIEARKAVGSATDKLSFAAGAGSVAKLATLSRRPQRPPVRSVAIERRRRLAASGPMPPALASRFTTGQLAALKVIRDDVQAAGVCTAPIDAIAARAGVCRTVVQNAIRQACRLGMLERQERRRTGAKSLPSVLRVVDREWLAWIRRGPKGIGLTDASTTETRGFREEEGKSAQPYKAGVQTTQSRKNLRTASRSKASRSPKSLQRRQCRSQSLDL